MKRVYSMNKDFESHFLSLPFHDKEAAQKCLDACDFNVHQNAYIPNAKWFLDNDSDEGVIYCCMLNTAYLSWQHQQAKVEELQKRVDACQNLLSKWKSAHLKGSSDYARGGFHARQNCEDELEQALKGEGNESN